jgi:hypothetical protein
MTDAVTPPEHSDSFRFLRPLLDIGPVPAGSSADGPLRLGQESAVTPHRDRVLLHRQPSGDVIRSHGVTSHIGIINCNVRVDKCRFSRYTRNMNTTQTTEITVGGWIATGRFFGKCKGCKALTRIDQAPTSFPTIRIECACGEMVTAKQVFGSVSDTPCDGRCMNATGPDCECSCGGHNHGGNR